jgi:hypothetical protein
MVVFRDGSDEFCHPHGTHVAGTIGGETFSVAKEVALCAERAAGAMCNAACTAGRPRAPSSCHARDRFSGEWSVPLFSNCLP